MSVWKHAIGAEAVRSGMGGVQLLVLAVALGPTEFGLYSQAFAVTMIVSPIALGGAAYWIQPYLLDASRANAVRSHLVLWAGLAVLVLAPLSALFLSSISGSDFLAILPVMASEMGVMAVGQHFSLVQLGLRSGGSYVLWSLLASSGKLAAAFIAWALAPIGLGGFGLLQLFIGSLTGVSYLVWSRWRPVGWFQAMRDNFARARAFSAVAICQVALDNLDKAILGGILPPSLMASLGFGSRLAAYALIPARGFGQGVYQDYFRLARDGNVVQLIRLADRNGWTGVRFTAPGIVGVLALVGLMSNTVLAEFDSLWWVSLLVAPRLLLRPFAYAYGDTLYAMGRAGSRLAVLGVTAAMYCLVLLLVAPYLGILGVALAGMIVELLNVVLLRRGMVKGVNG